MERQEQSRTLKRDKKFDSFISGGIAGACAKSVVAPMDRVKILFQVKNRQFTYKAAAAETLDIFTKQGVRGFWYGNVPNVLRVFPYASIQFGTFDYLRDHLHHESHTDFERRTFHFFCGSMAGMTATGLTYPLEFLRTRIALRKDGKQVNLRTGIPKIYKAEGLRGFYAGFLSSLMGIIPYTGTGFLIFHTLKDELKIRHPHLNNSKAFDFIFGAFSGLVAQAAAYPFDVIRKRLQAQNYFLSKGEIDKKRGTMQMIVYVVRSEGFFRGLYKGITMNFFKGPIAVGTSFTVKNIVNRFLDRKAAA